MKQVYQIIDDIIIRIANATGKRLDESKVSERNIYSELLDTRIFLLREKRLKGRQYSDFDIMTIPCIELSEAPYSECPLIPAKRVVRRSVLDVPKPLMGMFEAVIDPEANLNIDYVKWEDVGNYENTRYNYTNPLYTYQNYNNKIRIYIMDAPHIKYITLKILPEDPLEVLRFPVCGQTEINKCLDIRSQEFPMDADLIKTAKEIIIANYMQSLNLRGDIQQDNNDNTAVQKPNTK